MRQVRGGGTVCAIETNSGVSSVTSKRGFEIDKVDRREACPGDDVSIEIIRGKHDDAHIVKGEHEIK